MLAYVIRFLTNTGYCVHRHDGRAEELAQIATVTAEGLVWAEGLAKDHGQTVVRIETNVNINQA